MVAQEGRLANELSAVPRHQRVHARTVECDGVEQIQFRILVGRVDSLGSWRKRPCIAGKGGDATGFWIKRCTTPVRPVSPGSAGRIEPRTADLRAKRKRHSGYRCSECQPTRKAIVHITPLRTRMPHPRGVLGPVYRNIVVIENAFHGHR